MSQANQGFVPWDGKLQPWIAGRKVEPPAPQSHPNLGGEETSLQGCVTLKAPQERVHLSQGLSPVHSCSISGMKDTKAAPALPAFLVHALPLDTTNPQSSRETEVPLCEEQILKPYRFYRLSVCSPRCILGALDQVQPNRSCYLKYLQQHWGKKKQLGLYPWPWGSRGGKLCW